MRTHTLTELHHGLQRAQTLSKRGSVQETGTRTTTHTAARTHTQDIVSL